MHVQRIIEAGLPFRTIELYLLGSRTKRNRLFMKRLAENGRLCIRTNRFASSRSYGLRIAISACAALICLGMMDTDAAVGLHSAMSSAITKKNSDRLRLPPILEELCVRLATFGLVEPMGMERRSASRRECKPVLLPIDRRDTSEPTSIFTTVRAGSDDTAVLSIRFKVNVLEARTRDQAILLVERALRSILRSYDLEMPEDIAVAIERLEDGHYGLGPAQIEIQTEREDARRHNIFLSIHGDATQGMISGEPMPVSRREFGQAFDGFS